MIKNVSQLSKLKCFIAHLIDFKEIIRKEIVEKISHSIDFAFKSNEAESKSKLVPFDLISDSQKEGKDFEDSYFSDEENDKYNDIPKNSQNNFAKNKLLSRKATLKKESKCGDFFNRFFGSGHEKISRNDTDFKIFANRGIMGKVDLLSKNKIIDEANEKVCMEMNFDESDNTYIFENYASKIYKNVRRIYDITESDMSLCFGVDSLPDLDIKISSGKGGAFFLKNKKHSKLLIKSVSPGEYEIFKQFTGKYYLYLLSNPKTLLTPIFGVFTIALSDDNSIPDIHFIVMKSVFDPNLVNPSQKMVLFDLKGSEHGRQTLDDQQYELAKDMRTCPKSILKDTMKDKDFISIFGSIKFQKAEGMSSQLFNDSSFLCKNNFMDYSLLLFLVFDYGEKGKDEVDESEYDICDEEHKALNKEAPGK